MSGNLRITFDTGAVPSEDILSACKERSWDIATVSVSLREAEGTSFEAALEPLGEVAETGLYGEPRYAEPVFGREESTTELEAILKIISGGTFPKERSNLSKGHLHQLRDALIFEAHARYGRDIFVTNDLKGFIKGERREKLEAQFETRIMSGKEFAEFCKSGPAP